MHRINPEVSLSRDWLKMVAGAGAVATAFLITKGYMFTGTENQNAPALSVSCYNAVHPTPLLNKRFTAPNEFPDRENIHYSVCEQDGPVWSFALCDENTASCELGGQDANLMKVMAIIRMPIESRLTR